MSSHWEWQEGVVAEHNLLKPFAPENGAPLKFGVGDTVVFTNDYGVRFKLEVTGLYQPDEPCSLYATGRRYLLSWDSPWFPAKESQLEFFYEELLQDGYVEMIWEQVVSNGLNACEAYAIHDALSGCCPGRSF